MERDLRSLIQKYSWPHPEKFSENFRKNKNKNFTLTYFSGVSTMLSRQCSSALAREIRGHILAARKMHVQGQKRDSSHVFALVRRGPPLTNLNKTKETSRPFRTQ